MERRYESGRRAKLPDIIRIPLKEHLPEGHQQENHVIDEDYYWEKQGDATWEQMVALEDPYDAAFWVQAEHTYHGLNDKVRESRTAIDVNQGQPSNLLAVNSMTVPDFPP